MCVSDRAILMWRKIWQYMLMGVGGWGWMRQGDRQKVREFDPPQFSADRAVGANGQGHMAQAYVPAGSGTAKVADTAPHLCCDKTWTVAWRLNRVHSDSRGVDGSGLVKNKRMNACVFMQADLTTDAPVHRFLLFSLFSMFGFFSQFLLFIQSISNPTHSVFCHMKYSFHKPPAGAAVVLPTLNSLHLSSKN